MRDVFMVIAVVANLLGVFSALAYSFWVRRLIRNLKYENVTLKASRDWYKHSGAFWQKLFDALNAERQPRPLTKLEVADMRMNWDLAIAEGEDKQPIRFS